MDTLERVERAMACQTPFGNDAHILDQLRALLVQRLEQIAPDLRAAGELVDAVAHSPGYDYRRLFAETTLRSAIVHAHKQLASGIRRGSRLLGLADCEAVFTAAARYVERGGTDTPLQDGSLVPLGPNTHHGWIWQDGHADDSYGRAIRELVTERYGELRGPRTAGSLMMLQTGARLLEELLPSLAPSALHHAHLVACMPTSGMVHGSGALPDLGGLFFLSQSVGSPWWVAEHLLHESMHQKLFDMFDGNILVRSDRARDSQRPVVTPWNSSRLCGANHWDVWRALAAFHVYVHLVLLRAAAERRAPELVSTYGPLTGMTDSNRARSRARYLGGQLRLRALCRDTLGPVGQEMVNWLHSHLDILDPVPPPADSTLHLYLDLYRKETDRLEDALSEPTEGRRLPPEDLTVLARQDFATTRTVLRDLNAHPQLARLDTAKGRFSYADLGEGYAQIRRLIENCLLEASLDGYRMSESGTHDALIGQMVAGASDALFALSNGIAAPVADAKRRAVDQRFIRTCGDSVGRMLATQAGHLRPGAAVLEIGTGVGIATAWLVSGLGSRTDVDILSVDADEMLCATVRAYQWPSYVRVETADAEKTLADHPGTYDLILADVTALGFEHIDAVVDALRPTGMVILASNGASAAATEADAESLTTLRQDVLDHNAVVAVDIDWPRGVLVATKRV